MEEESGHEFLRKLDPETQRALVFLTEKAGNDHNLRKLIIALGNLGRSLEIKELKQEAKEAIHQIAREQLQATQLNSDLLYLHEVALRDEVCANQVRIFVKKIQSQGR